MKKSTSPLPHASASYLSRSYFPGIFLCILFQTTYFNAQSTFVKGYMLIEGGDTIKGEVKINPKKEHEAYNKFTFRDASGMQKICKPNKVKCYGYNGQHYTAMDSDGEPKYFRIYSKGDINFYGLMFETLHMNKVVYDSEYYIARGAEKPTVVREGKFKKQLGEWMKDNPQFLENYTDAKDFDVDKAVEVITQYNAWKATK